MEVSEFFLKLLVILLSAKFFAEVFAYLRLPSVLGEVIAGIIIGPSVLGIIIPDATFYLLAEVGKKNGIFDDTIYAVIVFVVALTTLFAPLMLRFIMRGEE